MNRELFYNCTLPFFCPLCQYSIDNYDSNNLSLNKILHQFYLQEYEPTTFTCYVHLKCNPGSTPSYLDCSDSNVDEKHCMYEQIFLL